MKLDDVITYRHVALCTFNYMRFSQIYTLLPGAPPAFLEGIGQGGRHLTAVNTLSAFGRFNEGGGGGGGLVPRPNASQLRMNYITA